MPSADQVPIESPHSIADSNSDIAPCPKRARKSCNLFDHLVGYQQKIATDSQTKRFGRLQIYNQLELGRLLYRQFRRFCAFEDSVQISCGRAGQAGQVYSI